MPHPNQSVVVRNPEVPGDMVPLDPAINYAADSAVVRAYPQFFAVREVVSGVVESVSVEQATAAPGEKRSRTRSR